MGAAAPTTPSVEPPLNIGITQHLRFRIDSTSGFSELIRPNIFKINQPYFLALINPNISELIPRISDLPWFIYSIIV